MKLHMRRVMKAAGVLLAAGVLTSAQASLAAPGDGYWSTSGSRIVADEDGSVIHITGSNWFGFETSNLMPHGLWSVNYRSFLDKVKSMGITVIRLPYSDDIMSNRVVGGINTYVNPELAGVTTLELMDKIVEYCGELGIRIILDRHRPDSGGQSKLWYTGTVSEATWIANMKALAARYKGNPTVVGFDLHNEPHADGTMPNATGACWGCGDVARDWRLAAERGGNAVLEANPDLLIVVEGASCPSGGTPNYWDSVPDEQCGWWGGNLSKAGEFPVRLSNPRKLVYSAHDYGMSVYPNQSWFADPAFPATLEPYWDSMWGYLQKENIAPVLIGEFGSTLQDPKDRVWLPTLLEYANRTGMSWTYWCLNPNSGDTKGLFLDDFSTIDTVRYDVIKPFLTPLVEGVSHSMFPLTVAKAGSGTGTVAGGSISCGTTCERTYDAGTLVTLTATPAAGSTFEGWSGACTGTSPTCTVAVTQPRAVTATFENVVIEKYTLRVEKIGTGAGTVTGGGISCGTSCVATFAPGAVVQLTATAASGSEFLGWSGDCTSGAVGMDANKVCVARFDREVVDSYGLTVQKTGSGSGTVTGDGIDCGATCSASVWAGSQVTLTATPAAGSTFGGWSGACTGTTPTCVVIMSAARSVTASFLGIPCIGVYWQVTKAGTGTGTVVSTPAGIECGTRCSAGISLCGGERMTFTATPAAGSRFVGWSGGCTGTAPTCNPSTSTPTIATFEAIPTEPCANPVTFTFNSGNFNTTNAVCYRTSQRVNGWGCSNMAGRTVSVNGVATTCGAGPLPLPQVDGYTYFSVTAGQYPWASIYLW